MEKMNDMMTPGAIAYILKRVISNANDALNEPCNEFNDGKRMAYYEVLDTIKNELTVRDQDLKEYGLQVDLERLFLGEVDFLQARSWIEKEKKCHKHIKKISMVRIELLSLSEGKVSYRYYPEDSKEFGILTFNRKTGERILEKYLEEYGKSYVYHAMYRIIEFQETGDFPQESTLIWY